MQFGSADDDRPLAPYGDVIERLAQSDRDAIDDPVDTNCIDIVDRDTFHGSKVYKSYCERAFQLHMDAVKRCVNAHVCADAENSDELRGHLQMVRDISTNLDDGHRQTADFVERLLMYTVDPVDCLNMFLANEDPVLKFLLEYAPNHSLTLACQCISSGPPRTFTFEEFYR